MVTDRLFGSVTIGDESFEKRFSPILGIVPKATIWMQQVHSPTIQAVMTPVIGSRIFPQTDGLMTNQKQTLLMTKTADCVPILLWNEKEQIVAALHCGWRGFFKCILESFAKKCRELGYPTDDFSAFLGPHLRKQSFDVGEDFTREIPENKKKYLSQEGSSMHYDLTRGVTDILNSMGIKNIEDSGVDTKTSHDYFSYREMGEGYSTFASCIMMTAA